LRHVVNRSVLAVLALFAAAAGDASAGSITYNTVNLPDYQFGYTVNGTITTDGTIGAVSAGDITAWSVQIYNASTSVTFTGQSATITIGLMASATELYLPAPNSPVQNELILAGSVPGLVDDASIGWLVHSVPSTFTQYVIQLSSNGMPNISSPPFLNPWVIATASVPEPSTVVMLGIAMVCLVAYSRRSPCS
jgi:PEP-CTERM motif